MNTLHLFLFRLAIIFLFLTPDAALAADHFRSPDFSTVNLVAQQLSFDAEDGDLVILSDAKGRLEFGEVYVRDARTKRIYLKNRGDAALRIDSIVSTNQDYYISPVRFKKPVDETDKAVYDDWEDQSKGDSYEIIEGDSLEIAVILMPEKAVDQEGSLIVYYNSTEEKSISLSGKGVADYLNVQIQSVESEKFPDVYANVLVDTLGTGINTLTASNFRIFENNDLQTNKVVITPPGQSGGARLADIVFIMDNSGSMSGEQAAISDNVIKFVTDLNNSGVDFALGLCRYGQGASGGAPLIQDNGILTKDPEYFKNEVWTRNIASGGTEPGYAAIKTSVNEFAFRPGAKKVIIIITDETPAQGAVGVDEALAACTDNSATLFALTQSSLYDRFTPITFPTNGKTFNIYSPFDEILNFITDLVSSTYLVQYRSDHPLNVDELYTLEIQVEYDGNTASDIISFHPIKAPRISLTNATKSLHLQSWGQGTSFNIEALITDKVEPFVQSARVYFRTAGQSAYQSVNMTETSTDIYSATLPAAAAQEPGLEYYIEASDGQATTTMPSDEPTLNPYQIAILPNEAPFIQHDTIWYCMKDQSITVEAEITDHTNSLASAYLYYRREGQLIYNDLQMTSSGGDQFAAVIPADFVADHAIEYYLLAKDNFGIGNYIGWPDHPLLIEQVGVVETITMTDDPSGVNDYINDIMPGGKIYKYYILRDEAGAVIPSLDNAMDVAYPCEINGKQVDLECVIKGEDTLVVSISSGDLPILAGDYAEIMYGEYLEVDKQLFRVQAVPAAYQVDMKNNYSNTSFDFYAGASLGAGVLIGGGGVGVTAAAAEISVKGSGGIGLNISINGDLDYTMSRRMQASIAASVTSPSVTLPVENLVDVKMGLYGGIETKFLYGQSIHLGHDANDDLVKLAKAGFILETATLGDFNFGPTAGVFLKAVRKTLLNYSNADAAIKQYMYEHFKGHGTDINAGIKVGVEIPHKENKKTETTGISLVDLSIGSSVSSKDIWYPDMPSYYKYNCQVASQFELSALSFDLPFDNYSALNVSAFKFKNVNMINYSILFVDDGIESMSVTLEGSNDMSVLNANVAFDNYYRTYDLPAKALQDIANRFAEVDDQAFLLTRAPSHPLKIGAKTLMNNLGYALQAAGDAYLPGDEPIRVSNFEDIGIGYTLPIDINLAAALGLGFKLSLGLEFSYFNSQERLAREELMIGQQNYVKGDYNYSFNPQVTLKDLMNDVMTSAGYLAKEAINNLVDEFVAVFKKAGEFLVEVGKETWEVIKISGHLLSGGTLKIDHYEPWTDIAYDVPFSSAVTKHTYHSKGVIYSDGSKSSRTAMLTIISRAYNITYLDDNDQEIKVFENGFKVSIPVSDSLLVAREFTYDHKPLARLYYYNSDSISWEEVSSEIENDTVTGRVYQPGTYALGIVTSPDQDNTAPYIWALEPDKGSVISTAYPLLEAKIKEENYGSGLDMGKISMTLNGDTLDLKIYNQN